TKVLIAGIDFADTSFEEDALRNAGIEVVFCPERSADKIIEHVGDIDGIITSYGVFNEEVFKAASPRLKVVARTGVGYDSIDVAAATAYGVAICTAPGYANEVVSDHAIALAMGLLRRINELDADLRKGIWDFAVHRPYGQAHGRVFGVVGMGDIGKATARKAHGLGFEVVCTSRSLTPGTVTEDGYRVLSLDELLAYSDVISLHIALSGETHHLINAEKLALCKHDAVIVNTARGGIIDTQALAIALQEGRLWGAGIDVFEDEPIGRDNPLLHAPHTLLTAHAAYWSEESARELRTRTVASVCNILSGKKSKDCLNPEVLMIHG
ncbi:MAG: C-terminal binding protein, partial [Eggerthellaceae bacterium]|nr:C-terminal binding protein [Eggerthellaceae bacterium]